MADASPPDGDWTVIERGGPFVVLVGPIFQSSRNLDPNEPMRFGFRVREAHCNPRLVCHGGMLATFLDVVLACALREQPGVVGPLPTISMTADFLAASPCGDWVESRVAITRLGGAIGFVSAMLIGRGGPVLRGSGTFRRFAPRDEPPGGEIS